MTHSWARPAVRVSTLAAGLLLAVATPALAAPASMVDLGRASTYAALSGASVGNTVSAAGAPHTTLRGDLGVKASTQPTGFPPGVVTGVVSVGDPTAAAAHDDLVAAYTEVAARTGGAALAGALAGTMVPPGLHTIAGAVSNTTTVTLDGGGDPNAVFVFQVNGALAMAAGSRVVLTGGAQASRVFWQVNGAGAIGANAAFAGTLMALDAVAVGNGTIVNGRVFARNGALTLDANEVYSGPPTVTITGGADAITTDTTPTITGTTDVEAPAVVTVTIHGQTLTAIPSGGAWSVTSAILANATYPVVASVTDGAGNPASRTQRLTVDTVLPAITFTGGASLTTNDSTPTISGTSDVAAGTVVRVSVDAQSLTALVQTTGTWNVTPGALGDGTRTVVAAVTDPAGNERSIDQRLTVDTTSPAVTITGGTTALTNDPTPEISGAADVAPGTTVSVSLANQVLTGPVRADGTWAITATALPDGPHRVVVSVSDGAGNPATAIQTLSVDTAAPAVTITGGASATTIDVNPTITGTCDAAPGTTVTVSIAGQTMTTLLQADGTWNATPAFVGEGTWSVRASAVDPARNTGSAAQTLTIAPAPVAPPPAPPATPAPPTPPRAPDAPPARTVAATTTIAPDSRQRVQRTKLSIPTKVTAPAGGRVVVTITGTVTIERVKKPLKLTAVTATVAAGRSATLRLVPVGTKRAVTAALKRVTTAARRGKAVTATITVTIVDDTGASRALDRTVQLTK